MSGMGISKERFNALDLAGEQDCIGTIADELNLVRSYLRMGANLCKGGDRIVD